MKSAITATVLLASLLLPFIDHCWSHNTTDWDLQDGMVPCLQGCSCHIEEQNLSVVCLSGDQSNTGANTSSYPLNGTMDLGTNDTKSALWEPHKPTNLTHLLLNIAATKIYVEGFRGQVHSLWGFFSGTSSIKEIYLKNCSTVEDVARGVDPDMSNSSSEVVMNRNLTDPLFNLAPQIHSFAVTMANISTITDDTFDRSHHLKTINLSGNMISMLNGSFLTNISSLENLNLSHNWLLMANLGCSQSLISLKVLDLSFNRIGNPAGVICPDGFPRLKILDLSHNQIEVLEAGSFEGFTNLRELDLSSNSIGEINLGSFGCGLDGLQSLLLQNNSISTLNLQVLVPLTRLYKLDLSVNQIRSITRSSTNNTNGSYCESHFPDFQSFENTDTFPALMNLWPQLELIDMSHNNITHLSQSVFEDFFKNSRKLDLSHNGINYVPRYGVEHLKGLEIIDLSHNLIDWMDVGTFTSPQLRDIDLSHNKLRKVISMTFLYLPNLRRLNLSHNKLNYLYRLSLYKTCKYGQRIHLDLTHNHLSQDAIWKFMSTFHEMKNDNCQMMLHFQNNRLRYLLDATSRQNFLQAFREDDPQFYHMWSHSLFNMSHNPFRCDCHLHQDISLIMKINEEARTRSDNDDNNLFNWENLLCEKPGSFKGLTLKEAISQLATSCEMNEIEDLREYYQECREETFQQGISRPCYNKKTKSNTFMLATVIASIGSLLGFVIVVFIFKKLNVIHCLTGRARWYRVYAEENHGNQSVAMYYHPNERSLVMNELVYFLQDCCPSHDIILHPSDDINDQMDQPSSTFPKTTLFIISHDLVQAIRGSGAVQAHYEAVIEQSQASVFLVMGNRGELELLYPHFWSKVKYRHNVYFVCGTDRLPKLQCVLTNVCGSDDMQAY